MQSLRILILIVCIIDKVKGLTKYRYTDESGLDEVRVSPPEFCAVKREAKGGLKFMEGTEELCGKATSDECFNPSPDVLCCRGDFCNANLKSTACTSYNPLRCHTGNGESPTELRNCQSGVKYCYYVVFTNEGSFEVQCAPEYFNFPCDDIRDGCRKLPFHIGYECCKPVEQGKNLAMDWGNELLKKIEDHEMVRTIGVFRSEFCAVKRDTDGGLRFSEGTKELCDEASSTECFNPSPDLLCCRGDLCNANLKSIACASYNPLRCPTGNGESPTELRNCQPGVKFCHYAVFTYNAFEAQCAPEFFNLICDDGCREVPTTHGYECCKPVEQGKNLDLDWGEAFARTLEDKEMLESFAN